MATIDTLGSFEQFLVSGTVEIDVFSMIGSLLVSAILSAIRGFLYVRYGTALSNRQKFARNFILLTMTTTLIIVIVKSSLALSLGLVGALSIVRFRAAIKEPEELAYLFLCIAIGLGIGAGQALITTVSFITISIFIIVRGIKSQKEDHHSLHLSVAAKGIPLEKIADTVGKYARNVTLKRFDTDKDGVLEASFGIDVDSFKRLEALRKNLESLSKTVTISFLDKSGIW